MDYSLTPEEIQAVEKYQDNDFKIMNTLLRSGIESEFRINSRNGKDYPYMTRDMMEKSLNDIANLYSAIIKQYLSNGSKKPEKPLYRGTKISLVDSMQNSNSSFLSTSTSIVQTMTFSRSFNKGSNVADESERAVLLVDGNVPWISIEKEFGGGEDEVLFVPSKISIEEANLTSNQRYGKEYIMRLSELDIPVKTLEEIEIMRKEILDKTEKMSDYLKYILVVKDNPNFNQNPRTLSVIDEYSKWKEMVIEYNYQQYIIIKNKLMGDTLSQNSVVGDNLNSKVEQEHFMQTEPLKEELIRFMDSLKDTKSEMISRGFEMPNLDDIFDEKVELENSEEKVEHIGRGIR